MTGGIVACLKIEALQIAKCNLQSDNWGSDQSPMFLSFAGSSSAAMIEDNPYAAPQTLVTRSESTAENVPGVLGSSKDFRWFQVGAYFWILGLLGLPVSQFIETKGPLFLLLLVLLVGTAMLATVPRQTPGRWLFLYSSGLQAVSLIVLLQMMQDVPNVDWERWESWFRLGMLGETLAGLALLFGMVRLATRLHYKLLARTSMACILLGVFACLWRYILEGMTTGYEAIGHAIFWGLFLVLPTYLTILCCFGFATQIPKYVGRRYVKPYDPHALPEKLDLPVALSSQSSVAQGTFMTDDNPYAAPQTTHLAQRVEEPALALPLVAREYRTFCRGMSLLFWCYSLPVIFVVGTLQQFDFGPLLWLLFESVVLIGCLFVARVPHDGRIRWGVNIATVLQLVVILLLLVLPGLGVPSGAIPLWLAVKLAAGIALMASIWGLGVELDSPAMRNCGRTAMGCLAALILFGCALIITGGYGMVISLLEFVAILVVIAGYFAVLAALFFAWRFLGGVLTDDKLRRVGQISDGLSKTLLFIESAGMPQIYVNGVPTTIATDTTNDGIYWYLDQVSFSIKSNVSTNPFINYTNSGEIYSFHTSGVTYARCDGSTHFLVDSIEPEPFVSLFTYNSGDQFVEP